MNNGTAPHDLAPAGRPAGTHRPRAAPGARMRVLWLAVTVLALIGTAVAVRHTIVHARDLRPIDQDPPRLAHDPSLGRAMAASVAWVDDQLRAG